MQFEDLLLFIHIIFLPCFRTDENKTCYDSYENGIIRKCCKNYYLINNSCQVCPSGCPECYCYQFCEGLTKRSGCDAACSCPDCKLMLNCKQKSGSITSTFMRFNTSQTSTAKSANFEENIQSSKPSKRTLSLSNYSYAIIIVGTLVTAVLLVILSREVLEFRKILLQPLLMNNDDPQRHENADDTDV